MSLIQPASAPVGAVEQEHLALVTVTMNTRSDNTKVGLVHIVNVSNSLVALVLINSVYSRSAGSPSC